MMDVKYEKLSYSRYQNRIKKILNDDKLKQLGINYEVIGRTQYGFPIDKISIGFGNKEMFIVGGTHGSEVIGVDFVTQLISSLKEGFDPNLMKIIFIPLQNPEGFFITTHTFKVIDDSNFLKESKEYYNRYRIDFACKKAIDNLNGFVNRQDFIDAECFLNKFKLFLNSDEAWLYLYETRSLPNLKLFTKYINLIDDVKSFSELKIKILSILKLVMNKIVVDNVNNNDYLYLFLTELEKGFDNSGLWHDISNENKIKLHQLMFQNTDFFTIKNKRLAKDIDIMYQDFPRGSSINHDANASGVNLNANNRLNPGINIAKRGEITYFYGANNNLKHYFKGPVGLATRNKNKFEMEVENRVLYDILNKSYQDGNYLMTLLYHGTGGEVYFKPYQSLMDEKNYQSFFEYNDILTNIYVNETGYKKIMSSDTTGFGDELRRTYPGVLLIELSKMRGNPLAPYGDKENIYNVMTTNQMAVKNLIGYLEKRIRQENAKKR
jgi:hypothetical protein